MDLVPAFISLVMRVANGGILMGEFSGRQDNIKLEVDIVFLIVHSIVFLSYNIILVSGVQHSDSILLYITKSSI